MATKVTVSAVDPKVGMTKEEMIRALVDVPDYTNLKVITNWKGNIKVLIFEIVRN